MALTKVTYGLLSADTSAIDLNIDANTLYVDSSANKVGIQTNSPSLALEVNDTSNVDGEQISIKGHANYGGTVVFRRGDSFNWRVGVGGGSSTNSTIPSSYFGFEQGNTASMVIAHTTGYVGIGTTNPSYKLEVNSGTSDWPARFISSDDKAGIIIADNDTVNYLVSRNSYLSMGGSSDLSATNLNVNKTTGFVGIGTTSPVYNFQVVGSGDTIASVVAGNSSVAGFNMGSSGTPADGGIRYDNSADKLIFRAGNATKAELSSAGALTLNSAYTFPTADGSANQVLQTDGSGALSFATISTSDSTKLPLAGGALTGNLSTNSRIAIGQSTFTGGNTLVDIHGSGSGVGANIAFANDHNTDKFYVGVAGDTTGDVLVYNAEDSDMIFATNNSERMRIDASGNIGIGTSSPSSKLTIDGSSGAYIRINNAASGDVSSGFQIYNGSNLDTQIYTNPTFGNTTFLSREALAIRTGGAERIRIASNGRVGIGTTGGNAGLHVANGDIRTTSAAFANDANSLSMSWESSGIGYLTARGPSTSERGKLGLSVNRSNGAAGITGLLIDNDGAVLINTTVNAESQAMRIRQGGSNANAALSLDSDTGDQSYYRYMRFYRKGQTSSVAKLDIDWSGSSIGLSFTSDARLKTVTGEADGLELITRLNPVKYVWKEEPDREGAQGFLAQEVEQAYYETGNTHARGVSRPIDGEKWYMLDDTTLIPNLVKAIKELKDENDALKARVEALES